LLQPQAMFIESQSFLDRPLGGFLIFGFVANHEGLTGIRVDNTRTASMP
jgi:hypothetical protein